MNDKGILKKALIEIESLKKKVDRAHEPIAVIGMACHFPGGLNTTEKFWDSLIKNESKIVAPPEGRWNNMCDFFKNSVFLKKAGFLDEDPEAFDYKAFRVTPKEAEKIDPQQKLLLKVCWEAFENSGYAPDSLKETNVGVYVGVSSQDFGNNLYAERTNKKEYDPLDITGTNFSFFAGRIAYFFGLQGPCLAIDTACSSSLVAINQAYKALQSNECNLAIAGGVNIMYAPETSYLLSELNILSSDCEIRSFDDNANGTVRGEGCGMVVLKRLADAKRDNNNIYAVILGGSVNQDGPSSGITAPYGPAQEKLLKKAWENSNVDSRDVGYIETHGTGTKLGDPIEVKAIAKAISEKREKHLYIGTVKTNIGHLEAAAGIAGLIKTVLIVKEGVIPANLNFVNPSKYIQWDKSPLLVSKENIKWDTKENKLRTAGVSAFGLSGTNAHIVVQQYAGKDINDDLLEVEKDKYFLKFSSFTVSGLREQLKQFKNYLSNENIKDMGTVSYSQNISKADLPKRVCLFGSCKKEIEDNLQMAIDGIKNQQILYSDKKKKNIFMFTGQGAQYLGMCRDLYESNQLFRKYMNQCNEYYKKYTNSELLNIIFYDEEGINKTKNIQPALFAVEYSLTKMWLNYGIEVDILLGHSLGEYVAACIAGVFSLEDAIKLVTARGKLMELKTPPAGMVAISCNRSMVESIIDSYNNVWIAVTNEENQTVISGDCEEIKRIEEMCNNKGIKAKVLKVNRGFHSPLMRSMVLEFEKVAKSVNYSMPRKKVISNITGEVIGREIANYKYWCKHILSEVKFYNSIRNIRNPENYIFFEFGPKPVLTAIVESIHGSKVVCINSYCKEVSGDNQRDECLGYLYVNGQKINWKKYYEDRKYNFTVLPNYKFEEKNRIKEFTEENFFNTKYVYKFSNLDEIKKYTRKTIKDEFGIEEEDLTDNINLLTIGLNSIMISRILVIYRSELGIELSVGKFIQKCTIEEWAIMLLEQIEKRNDGHQMEEYENEQMCLNLAKRNDPFGLNAVQYAYWAGRNKEVYLGGVSCYASFEIDIKNLDIQRFKNALEKTVMRHDMLRCMVYDNGTQKVLEEIDIPLKVYYRTQIENLEEHLKSIREEISYKVIPFGSPLFDIRITEMDNDEWRIHFAIDFMISDALSIHIFWRDLNSFYMGKKLQEISLTFKDYLEYFLEKKDKTYLQNKNHWLDKIDNFPESPQLPIRITKKEYGKFRRRKYWIDPEEWKKFVFNAGKYHLTASAALLSLYSEVISAWGGGSQFAIMLTLFNRKNIHENINDIIGDFTNLLLMEIHRTQTKFNINASDIQKQMQADLEHSEFSGIDFLKELRDMYGNNRYYPIVFTSALGIDILSKDESNVFLDKMDGIVSSTPQVLLDHQVYNEKNGVVLSWDSLDDMFYPDVIENMFQKYAELVQSAIDDDGFWEKTAEDLRPSEQIQIQDNVNMTSYALEDSLLYENFQKNSNKYPENTAVIFQDKKYTYAELQEKANKVSALLEQNNLHKGERIAIQMKKSFNQIAVVLGILQQGCVYVPFIYNQPIYRTSSIIKKANIKAIFVDEVLENEEIQDTLQFTPDAYENIKGILPKPEIDSSYMAYVIYTSGSTGEPKGVCINHNAAMNTINDINRRFQVGSADCILAVSALSFDLSVYDIFGLLSAGGTIVMPTEEERIDPRAWSTLFENYKITLWNSVPALMTIFLDYISNANKKNKSLRRVLLSGDWLPINLIKKMKEALQNAEVTSLGGATEASIWSNYYNVKYVHNTWSSIPYGYPLSNQAFYILDVFGRRCPEWVQGKLYIAGKGLSTGYLGQKDLTERAFVFNEKLQQRIYETGDYGRYMRDGVIEFLGRKDSQVKVNGYRVELGEIKEAFVKGGIKTDVIIHAIGKTMESKKIIAFVVQDGVNFTEQELKNAIRTYIPQYFIPEKIIFIEKVPITLNGKVDNRKLEEIYNRSINRVSEKNKYVGYENSLGKTIGKVLNVENLTLDDNFAELGVSSVDMIRLANELEVKYGNRPTVREMISYQKISEIFDFYKGKEEVVMMDEKSSDIAVELCPYSKEQIKFLSEMNGDLIQKEENSMFVKENCFDNSISSLKEEGNIRSEIYSNLILDILKQIVKYLENVQDEMQIRLTILDDNTFKLSSGIYCLDNRNNVLILKNKNLPSNISDLYDDKYKVIISVLENLKTTYPKYNNKAPKYSFMNAGVISDIIKKTTQEYEVNSCILEDTFCSEEEVYLVPLVEIALLDNPKLLDERYKIAKELIKKCENDNIKLYLENDKIKYRGKKGVINKEILIQLKENKEILLKYLACKKSNMLSENNKFSLTPIQWAYVMGRGRDCELGNISAHYYTEFKWENLDVKKLEAAFNSVIKVQDILRTVVYEDGKQEVHEDVPSFKIPVVEIKTNAEFVGLRKQWSHHSFTLGQWPMFRVQVNVLPNNERIVQFEFDCIILDGWSSEIMLQEVYKAYLGYEVKKPGFALKEYIEKENEWIRKQKDYDEDKIYWKKQIKKLPPAPVLPVVRKYGEIEKPYFKRKLKVLSGEDTDRLFSKIKKYKFTPSAFICTAYMKILSSWSENKDITLNLTLFNRLPMHKDVEKMLGDFTNITLIPYFKDEYSTFKKEVENVQKYFWQAVEYRNHNGLDLLKILSKDTPGKAVMPIVFTSMLFGETSKKHQDIFEVIDEVYSISQTPQVALDHQALVRKGKIYLIWDYIDELFDSSIIDEMFNQYIKFIDMLIKVDEWDVCFDM